MTNLRQRILDKAKPRTKRFTPEFLGEEVEAREISLAQRRDIIAGASKIVKSIEDGEVVEKTELDSALLQAMVVIECTFDLAGDQVFGRADLEMLTGLPAKPLDDLALPSLEINGMQMKAAEIARKNLSATPSGSPSSASPSAST